VRCLRQLVVDADTIARKRGDRYGLCDCIDSAGNPYPSPWSAELIRRVKAKGVDSKERLKRKSLLGKYLTRADPPTSKKKRAAGKGSRDDRSQ